MALGPLQKGTQALQVMLSMLSAFFTLPLSLFTLLYNLAAPPAPIATEASTILITGATSGIGRALAVEYAKEGVTLLLTGRNAERLATVTAECEGKGAAVVAQQLDVTDAAATEAWVKAMDAATPVDMVIANAGVSANSAGVAADDVAGVTRTLFSANVDGVFNTILPLVQPMKDRKGGQIVIMSSQASFSPMASYTYNATKAAVRFWGEGLRQDLVAWGIAVNVVCPGFVRSPMTDKNSFFMPGMVEMEDAVEAIVSGLAANEVLVTFPAVTMLASGFLGGLSPTIRDAMARSKLSPTMRARSSTTPRGAGK